MINVSSLETCEPYQSSLTQPPIVYRKSTREEKVFSSFHLPSKHSTQETPCIGLMIFLFHNISLVGSLSRNNLHVKILIFKGTFAFHITPIVLLIEISKATLSCKSSNDVYADFTKKEWVASGFHTHESRMFSYLQFCLYCLYYFAYSISSFRHYFAIL